MSGIDRRVRLFKQAAASNRVLGESVQSLQAERDGLLAQLSEANDRAADLDRSKTYAEDLALQSRDAIASLTAERDQLAAEVAGLRAQLTARLRVQKGT